jgi:hypothetical protein
MLGRSSAILIGIIGNVGVRRKADATFSGY